MSPKDLDITPHEAQALLSEVRQAQHARNVEYPVEALDESGIEIGRAIEAGRLAARSDPKHEAAESTQQMREAEALISVARIGNGHQKEDVSQLPIIITVGVILLFVLLISIHFLQ